MLIPGLVSITFRKQTVPEIIHLVMKAGVKSIEWGGDVHVPHGKIAAAQDARKRTEDAGLRVAAYGSYYRVGRSEEEELSFEQVLESAVELKAPTIRVWAGAEGSAETNEKARAKIVRETRRIADLAAREKISISFEFHGNTLTDTNESTQKLLEEVDHENVLSLWQPRTHGDVEESLAGLEAVLPRLSNVHAFHWTQKKGRLDRRPLQEGEKAWARYLEVLHRSGRDHQVLIEFVRNDDPAAFLADARTLRNWLSQE